MDDMFWFKFVNIMLLLWNVVFMICSYRHWEKEGSQGAEALVGIFTFLGCLGSFGIFVMLLTEPVEVTPKKIFVVSIVWVHVMIYHLFTAAHAYYWNRRDQERRMNEAIEREMKRRQKETDEILKREGL